MNFKPIRNRPFYYAVFRPYGYDVLNTGGCQANTIWAFGTPSERAKWVAADPERRIPMSAKEPLIRRLLRDPEFVQFLQYDNVGGWPFMDQ